MEITSISAALAGIKSATEIAKIIKDSGASLEKAEVKLQLADLISALADAKIEIANIREAISDKETEINALKQKLEIKENIVWEKPYYFVVTNDNKDGPYCQKCYDSKQLLIRLQGEDGWWQCHECTSTYTDDTYDNSPVNISPDNGFF